jgi:hypothetical protein
MMKEVKAKIFNKGDIVMFEGSKHKVVGGGYIAAPQNYMIRAKPGYFYNLYPLEEDVEEPSGLISSKWIKKLGKKKRW